MYVDMDASASYECSNRQMVSAYNITNSPSETSTVTALECLLSSTTNIIQQGILCILWYKALLSEAECYPASQEIQAMPGHISRMMAPLGRIPVIRSDFEAFRRIVVLARTDVDSVELLWSHFESSYDANWAD